MLAYAARFEPEGKGFVVTFPDFPEAITEGNSLDEAKTYAIDALETILSEYINRRMEIPNPSRYRGAKIRYVRLPALDGAKLALYRVTPPASIKSKPPCVRSTSS